MRSAALVFALIGLGIVSAGGTPAAAFPPSPDSGAELAARWCADCHQENRHDAPSFQALASGHSLEELRAALAKPHGQPMTGISLNRHEIEDVAAYIKALRD